MKVVYKKIMLITFTQVMNSAQYVPRPPVHAPRFLRQPILLMISSHPSPIIAIFSYHRLTVLVTPKNQALQLTPPRSPPPLPQSKLQRRPSPTNQIRMRKNINSRRSTRQRRNCKCTKTNEMFMRSSEIL